MLHKLPVRAAFPLPFCLLRAAEPVKLRRAQRACLFSSAGKQSAARQAAFLSPLPKSARSADFTYE